MKEVNLKNKNVLCYDYGLFTELAASLVPRFKQVFYYIPWQDAFPSSAKQKIGMDFKGLTRVQEFWNYVDEADLIVFFDTYTGDLANYLRRHGKRVFGAGEAEAMELKRWNMRDLQKMKGMPTQNTLKLTSVDDLETYFEGIENQVKKSYGNVNPLIVRARMNHLPKKYNNFSRKYFVGDNSSEVEKEFLKGAKNKFVKVNNRGDIESFFAPDYNDAGSKINSLAEKLGHRGDADEVQFVIEDSVKGIEPGFDGIQVNGQFLSPTMWGFEKKGAGYIGKITSYDNLPGFIKESNKPLTEIMKELKPTSSFFSTEIIVGKDKKPYLIDPTVRCPAPVGSAIYSELYKNLADILWFGAEGEVVEPETIKAKYVAGMAYDSDWAQDHELEVEFPLEVADKVKMRMAYGKNNKIYAAPGFSSILSVVGFGETIDEAVADARKSASKVKGYGLNTGDKLDKIAEEIKEAEKDGILQKNEF